MLNKLRNFPFPYYVISVNSFDEYGSDEPTHCAIKAHPFVVFLITWYVFLAYLLTIVANQFSEVRFYFPNVTWATTIEDADLLDDESTEIAKRGGVVGAQKFAALFCSIGAANDERDEIQVLSPNYFRLLRYRSDAEYFTDAIDLSELFRNLFDYFVAEAKKHTFRVEWHVGHRPHWSLIRETS